MKGFQSIRARSVGIVLLAALLAAACGGGGGGGSPGVIDPPVQPPLTPARAFDPAAAAQLNTDTSVAPSASEPVVGSDAAGNIIAAWIQPDGARNNVFARRMLASGVFEDQVFIGFNNGGSARNLRLKVNANGHAVAIWEQPGFEGQGAEDEVVVSVYDQGKWTPKQLTNNTDTGGVESDSEGPDVAFGPAGMIVATWRQTFKDVLDGDNDGDGDVDLFNLQSANYDPGTKQWSAVEQVSGGASPNSRQKEQRVAVLTNGDAVVVAISESTQSSVDDILLRRRDAATGFWSNGNFDADGEPIGLTGLPPQANVGGRMDSLDLAANEAGHVQIVWRHEFDLVPGGRQAIATAYLVGTSTWVVPGQVDSTAPDPDSFGDLFGLTGKNSLQPRIVMDKTGKSTIVWRQDDAFDNGTIESIYAVQFDLATGRFDAAGPQLVDAKPDDTEGAPAISVDGSGNVFVAWAQQTAKLGNLDIDSMFASRFDASSKTWSAPALVEGDDQTSVTQSSMGIAMAPDGTATAVWAQAKRILFNRFK
jgi:hypothetical protein